RGVKKIFIKRDLMVLGEPCYEVFTFERDHSQDGSPWVEAADRQIFAGFTARGVVFINAADGHSWVEFHGDDANFVEAGLSFAAPDEETVNVDFNLLPASQMERVVRNPDLTFGAVNRIRLMRRESAVVTAYRWRDGMYPGINAALVAGLRMQG